MSKLKFTFAFASLALAMAFAFGCSLSGDDGYSWNGFGLSSADAYGYGGRSSSSAASYYTLTANASPPYGGTALIDGSWSSSYYPGYEYGAVATVMAEPNQGYKFVEWVENGNAISRSQSTQIAMNRDKSITAVFEPASAAEFERQCPSYNPSTHFCDARDCKIYKYAIIGSQVWMAENLNYSSGSSACYNNQSSYCDKYGRLYDWATAMGSSQKDICPDNWHIPSDYEWDELLYHVGYPEGAHLKSGNGWEDGGNGDDDCGFNALPGGLGDSEGYFRGAGEEGYWWSASEYNPSDSYYGKSMASYSEYVDWFIDWSPLYSVRCVRD